VKQRGRLSPERVAFALFVSPNKTAAAASLGVSAPTLYKYLRDPRVLIELKKLRESVVEHNVAAASELVASAMGALKSVLDDPSASDFLKVRAADIVLSRLHSVSDVEPDSVEFVDDSNDSDNEDN
jgi:hypothetical protein